MTSPIRVREFWVDVLARSGRNAVQVVIPLLVLASTGQVQSAGILTTLAAAGLAALASVLKAMTPLTSDSSDSIAWQVFERAVGAAAGAALAVFPLSWMDAVHMDWRVAAVSVAGSVGLSLVSWVTNTPADVQGRHEAAA